MEPLTPQQQKLVEDNHNLIYSLAYKKNINLDEFYGDLAIGLCKAALAFDENRGKFSTLAYTSMYNEYKIRLRQITAEEQFHRIRFCRWMFKYNLKIPMELLLLQI